MKIHAYHEIEINHRKYSSNTDTHAQTYYIALTRYADIIYELVSYVFALHSDLFVKRKKKKEETTHAQRPLCMRIRAHTKIDPF